MDREALQWAADKHKDYAREKRELAVSLREQAATADRHAARHLEDAATLEARIESMLETPNNL